MKNKITKQHLLFPKQVCVYIDTHIQVKTLFMMYFERTFMESGGSPWPVVETTKITVSS